MKKAMLPRISAAVGGAVAVETALVASFILVPLLLGVWDIGEVAFAQQEVEGALQDAVTYVAAGNAGNGSGITSAAQAAYGTTISVSTSTACYCVRTDISPSTPTAATCGGSCSGANDLEQFMTITTSKTVSLPFHVPYFGSSVSVSASGLVRTG